MSSLTIPASGNAPSTNKSNIFIVSPVYDSLFFFTSVSAVVIAWIAADFFHINGFYILATVAVLSNGPHLTSTWTRVYMDRSEWEHRLTQVFVMPVLITLGVITLTFLGGIGQRLLDSLLFYWASWHFVAQNYGILRIYQRRTGKVDASIAQRIERPLIYLFVLWCMMHRLKTGPRQLFGQEILYFDFPWLVINILLIIVLCLSLLYLWQRLCNNGYRDSSHLLRIAFISSIFIGFGVPFLLMTEDGTSAFAAAACWHGFQYLGVMRFYHRNAWNKGVNQNAKLISWLSQKGKLRLFLYICLLWTLSGAGYLVIWSGAYLTQGTWWTLDTWAGVTWLSMTFSHYYLDGVIWKLQRDKKLAMRLLIDNDGSSFIKHSQWMKRKKVLSPRVQ